MQVYRTMLTQAVLVTAFAAALACYTGTVNAGTITLLTSPGDFAGEATLINFEGFPDNTIANDLYVGQGVQFTRDDGNPIPIENWSALGRSTTSPSNVIATISGIAPSFVDHLNLVFTVPQLEVGAFFGNDQIPDFASVTLSGFDVFNAFVGSVTVPTNNNTDVDQFIGLRSDVPLSRVRFQNNESSVFFSVVLDDVRFSETPEPSTGLLLATSLVALALWHWRQKQGEL